MAKYFIFIAIVAKFRQMRSHCLWCEYYLTRICRLSKWRIKTFKRIPTCGSCASSSKLISPSLEPDGGPVEVGTIGNSIRLPWILPCLISTTRDGRSKRCFEWTPLANVATKMIVMTTGTRNILERIKKYFKRRQVISYHCN